MNNLERYKVYYRIWDGEEMTNAYTYTNAMGVRKLIKRGTLIDKIIDTKTGEEV